MNSMMMKVPESSTTRSSTWQMLPWVSWKPSRASATSRARAALSDTRSGDSPDVLRAVPAAKIGGGNVLEVQVTDLPGYTPAIGVSAVSLNVTATNTEAAGYVTVFACGTMEKVSSLNYDADATVANAVLAPVSDSGTICLYSRQLADVVVDINGWIGTAHA